MLAAFSPVTLGVPTRVPAAVTLVIALGAKVMLPEATVVPAAMEKFSTLV